MKAVLSVAIDVNLFKTIDELRDKRGGSRSALVEHLLRMGIKRYTETEK